ncbi:zinc finger CCCH domain-containing protein 18 [Phlebotomus argentipes]|uniref:zinc finger CCCH domain-containing protein 18 n=1 Tax=Phlebotomus argentipes TaxID=94469 RepID=UPI002892D2F1|nr:zinc finger CCCH domain-containing protein 18 [Phlebotomus argentipes]XP_059622336.1 zinc finger CCCH domain-containing protein 18 [Phlebotomus argentipes]
MDSDEESAPGSPTSNSPSSPRENASNSDGSDSSDSESNASAPEENLKTPNSPDAVSRDQSSSDSSSSNDSFRATSPAAAASREASQDVSQDGPEPQQQDSPQEAPTEELSDSVKEAEEEKEMPVEEKKGFDLAHEDLSDVSDVDSESSLSGNNLPQWEESPPRRKDGESDGVKVTDLREKLNARKKGDEEFVATNGTKYGEEKKNDEDALDFEAEDGECPDESKEVAPKKEEESEAKAKEADEELEEGEVTDDDERRPEETEPKPVCRFYARGQCTWGVSCRFLHPGVTDKGNYTMFDMVRPIAGGQTGMGGGYDYRERPKAHIPSSHHAPVIGMGLPAMLPRPSPLAETPGGGESPWERGLRTAKEMLRKANKRKEQDLDFEDKKMNLSTGQEDIDRDYYSVDKAGSPDVSPPAPFARAERYSPPPKFPQRKHYMEEDAFGRTQRYRELPPHRMPQYEDERRVRPVREVIVQRSEPARDDEWSDPWMRSKSPSRGGGEKVRGERERENRSWSSKSYSSSSSSQSDSSSESSRSKSPPVYKKREKKARSGRTSKGRESQKRYSQSAEKRYPYGRQTDGRAHSPVVASNKRALERINASQHPLKRRKSSPSAKEARKFDRKASRRSRSSSSGSSDSSGSDSESSASSSTDDSSRSARKKAAGGHPTAIRHKTTTERPAKQAEPKEPASTPIAATKKTTRREELLKQLKAVEDAIARKRSKISS